MYVRSHTTRVGSCPCYPYITYLIYSLCGKLWTQERYDDQASSMRNQKLWTEASRSKSTQADESTKSRVSMRTPTLCSSVSFLLRPFSSSELVGLRRWTTFSPSTEYPLSSPVDVTQAAAAGALLSVASCEFRRCVGVAGGEAETVDAMLLWIRDACGSWKCHQTALHTCGITQQNLMRSAYGNWVQG